MIPVPTVEERLRALEQAVEQLRRRLASSGKPSNWLERITGSMADNPAFEEAMEYARAIRAADRPADLDDSP